MVELRARKSSLLGFGTHADFVLEMNMAKSAKRVAAFLGEQAAVCRWSFPLRLDAFPSLSSEELYRKLKPLGDDERSLILKLKEEECRKRALPFDGQLRAWDTRYFMTQVTQRPPVAAASQFHHRGLWFSFSSPIAFGLPLPRKVPPRRWEWAVGKPPRGLPSRPWTGSRSRRPSGLSVPPPQVEESRYAVDQNLLKEYFPMDVVTRGLLDIYQELLGLSFELLDGAPVWHPDVKVYSVKDLAGGRLLGQFYLDLYPR